MSTRIKEYTLNVAMSSTEGVNDFIGMLQAVIDDIKGGVEDGNVAGAVQNMQWKIDVNLQEYDQRDN